ncbi:stage III sporulation protein SpoIIIAB [Thermoactinomyces mirandus]|uniref:Stage III sporulation protein AB n=1 Tax=Thermoactinomyces mirandus TaxID=2756294 RepID=A0A7W1XPM3_9BACL|nr:stage III sporulation protein SpoIIIAB [Thermoactinomyces mirandus]MBA4600899.1 stage III sporulation protein AB [Thermoactinomyces mirandus]
MLKLLGAVLIILTTSWIGFQLATEFRMRPRQIQELRSSLALLKTEIDYGTRPLAEACDRIAEAAGSSLSQLFQKFSRNLRTLDGKSTYECLRLAIESEWRKTAMGKEEKGIILKLCQVLGGSNRSDQLHHLEIAAENLLMEEQKARVEQEKYEKMIKTFGILSGVLLVILMY